MDQETGLPAILAGWGWHMPVRDSAVCRPGKRSRARLRTGKCRI